MKNLLFHKLFLVLMITVGALSCQSQKPMFTIYQTEHWLPTFGEGFQKALYKGTLDIREIHLTGLMLIKRTSDTTIRIVFTNEIGMRFFDLEFSGEKMIKHYLFPSMDKSAFVSILENDLRMMMLEDFSIGKFSKETKDEIIIYNIQSNRGNQIYTINKQTKRIKNINTTGKKVKKTLVNFHYGESDIPTGIIVDNPFIKLHMVLNLIEDK